MKQSMLAIRVSIRGLAMERGVEEKRKGIVEGTYTGPYS